LQIAFDLYDALSLLLEASQQLLHLGVVHLIEFPAAYGQELVATLKTAVRLAIRLDEVAVATPTQDPKARSELA
jgi:hypothetical protein